MRGGSQPLETSAGGTCCVIGDVSTARKDPTRGPGQGGPPHPPTLIDERLRVSKRVGFPLVANSWGGGTDAGGAGRRGDERSELRA